MISSILSSAWRVYCQRFGVIAAVVIVVGLPCELLSSYFDAFVFGPDDIYKSTKFSTFLDNFIGIISTAGVIFIAFTAHSGMTVSFGSAIGAGFGAWGRMWLTRFLSSIAVVLGFLLLIIPGVYLFTRLCFAETIAVVERVSGITAIKRSLQLTNNRFWQTFRLVLIVVALVVVPVLAIALLSGFLSVFFPVLDHWLIAATTSLFFDFITAFATVALLCGYEVYSNELTNAEQPPQI